MTPQNGRATIPEDCKDLLGSTPLARVATIEPRGEPRSSPVWFGLDGEHVESSQARTRQKCRNVNQDPRTVLSVVGRIEEDPDFGFIGSMPERFSGLRPYQDHGPGDERVVVCLERTFRKDG